MIKYDISAGELLKIFDKDYEPKNAKKAIKQFEDKNKLILLSRLYPAKNCFLQNGQYPVQYMVLAFLYHKNIGIRMKYTGKILVGKDFLREYYIHMGYQRAWAYQTLVEFIFEDGSLLDTVDHSQMASC